MDDASGGLPHKQPRTDAEIIKGCASVAAAACGERRAVSVEHEFMQLVGVDTPNTPCGAFLFTEETRLLFNVPEGTQRFAGEAKIRLPKVTAVFFTRVAVETVMGLPGLLFTINDVGVKSVTMGGPQPHLANFWASTHKTFFTYRQLEAQILSSHTADGSGEPVLWKHKTVEIHQFSTGDGVVSFLCINRTLQRKFDPRKAKALGVKPGPKYALLKAGTAVESDAEPGKMVQPADVVEGPGDDATSLGGAVLVLDVNSADDARALLLDGDALHPRFPAAIHTIFHLAPSDVVQSDEYGLLVAHLRSACPMVRNHVMGSQRGVDGCVRQTAFPTAYVQRLHLHALAPFVFPIPNELLESEEAGTLWRFGRRYSLSTGAECVREAFSYPTQRSASAMLGESFFETHISNPLAAESPAPERSTEFPAVSFLGTGSAIPSKYRNVSCTLLELGEEDLVLCDCGEGSLGQLWNLCGDAGLERVVMSTRLVFISHSHADHNLGLLAFLRHRAHVLREAGLLYEPLLVVCPVDVASFFVDLSGLGLADLSGVAFDTFQCEHPTTSFSPTHLPRFAQLCAARGWAAGLIFGVDHPAHAQGLLLRTGTFSCLFSGDTRPGAVLPDAVARSVATPGAPPHLDLLIHEATFADGMEAEAKAKKHSTVGEALAVAGACAAAFTLLTHFSQRYPKVLPRAAHTTPCCFAFDLMRIARCACPQQHVVLAALMPKFQALLQEYDSWGHGTSKRMRQDEGASLPPPLPQ